MENDNQVAPGLVATAKVRFTQRERRGVFLGLTGPQLVTVCVAPLMLITVLFTAPRGLWVAVPVAMGIVAVGSTRVRQVPVVTLIAQSWRYLWRSARGQTRFRRNVWRRVSVTALPTGHPPELLPVPKVFKSYVLPGGIGDAQFIDIPTRGGFTFNPATRQAAVTASVNSEPWRLMDLGAKDAAYEGFTAWMSELEGMGGLVEALVRVRVDRAATTGLSDYAASRDEHRDTEISSELVAAYDELIETASASAMEFSSYVTLVIDTSKLRTDIRDAGGGLAGLGAILADRVEALTAALDACQVTVRDWLDAEQLDDLVATSFDPVTAASRRERFGTNRKQMRTRPPVMSVDENWSTLTADDSWHQVLWVSEWPRTQVQPGFLERLMYAGDSTRCITLQLRPVPLHKAMSEVTRAQADMDAAETVRLKFNARLGVEHDREKEDLLRREEQLADGYTDVRFRAFVTLSARTERELRRSRTALEQAAYGSNMVLTVLHRQQWSGFTTAVLPIGTNDQNGAKG